MGFRGSQTANSFSTNAGCRLRGLVGGENRGVAVVMSGLDLERAMVAPFRSASPSGR